VRPGINDISRMSNHCHLDVFDVLGRDKFRKELECRDITWPNSTDFGCAEPSLGAFESLGFKSRHVRDI